MTDPPLALAVYIDGPALFRVETRHPPPTLVRPARGRPVRYRVIGTAAVRLFGRELVVPVLASAPWTHALTAAAVECALDRWCREQGTPADGFGLQVARVDLAPPEAGAGRN